MKRNQKPKRTANPPRPRATPSRVPRWAAGLLVVAVLAAGAFWWSKGRDTASLRAASATPDAQVKNSSPVTAAPNSALQKLKGQWLRPDGGYVLEIQEVEASGTLHASYHNPRPINVSKAMALQDGSIIKVFIELRDVNYPGSTYTLVYQADNDQLSGSYYQAALKQQFEVVFERMK